MKAIVLTYDKYHSIADHMIHCYMKLWPNNPFVFFVPYQKFPEHLHNKYGDKIKLIKTEPDIKSTMTTLLSYTDDEEWIYWCMDDRYPTFLDVKNIKGIYKWLNNNSEEKVSGLIFSYKRSTLIKDVFISNKKKLINGKEMSFYRVKNYRFIWFHQFLKAKVLKSLFDKFPSKLEKAKDMDYHKDELLLPKSQEVYLCAKRLAVFGESSNRGKLTPNCVKSMENYGFMIPKNFEILDKEIYKGDKNHEKSKTYYMFKNAKRHLHSLCRSTMRLMDFN